MFILLPSEVSGLYHFCIFCTSTSAILEYAAGISAQLLTVSFDNLYHICEKATDVDPLIHVQAEPIFGSNSTFLRCSSSMQLKCTDAPAHIHPPRTKSASLSITDFDNVTDRPNERTDFVTPQIFEIVMKQEAEAEREEIDMRYVVEN